MRVYDDDVCTGTPLASGSAAAFASAGLRGRLQADLHRAGPGRAASRSPTASPGFYRLLITSSTTKGPPGRTTSLYLWVLAPPRARTTT